MLTGSKRERLMKDFDSSRSPKVVISFSEADNEIREKVADCGSNCGLPWLPIDDHILQFGGEDYLKIINPEDQKFAGLGLTCLEYSSKTDEHPLVSIAPISYLRRKPEDAVEFFHKNLKSSDMMWKLLEPSLVDLERAKLLYGKAFKVSVIKSKIRSWDKNGELIKNAQTGELVLRNYSVIVLREEVK